MSRTFEVSIPPRSADGREVQFWNMQLMLSSIGVRMDERLTDVSLSQFAKIPAMLSALGKSILDRSTVLKEQPEKNHDRFSTLETSSLCRSRAFSDCILRT